jgi:hypothetical protein
MMDTKALNTIHKILFVNKETGEEINPVPVNLIVRDEEEHARMLEEARMIRDMGSPYFDSYRMIGESVDSLSSMFPPSEPMTMKQRKKNYNDGLKKLFNKGKKW